LSLAHDVADGRRLGDAKRIGLRSSIAARRRGTTRAIVVSPRRAAVCGARVGASIASARNASAFGGSRSTSRIPTTSTIAPAAIASTPTTIIGDDRSSLDGCGGSGHLGLDAIGRAPRTPSTPASAARTRTRRSSRCIFFGFALDGRALGSGGRRIAALDPGQIHVGGLVSGLVGSAVGGGEVSAFVVLCVVVVSVRRGSNQLVARSRCLCVAFDCIGLARVVGVGTRKEVLVVGAF
jgi:hypothetical protein